jgi:3-(3-hydroxy-phenyl)propionate hydroxylase
MQPYTYSESPLTPYAGRDADFAAGPASGGASPNAKLADGTHLLDRAGDGMTAMLFGDGSPNAAQAALLEQLGKRDKRFVALLIQCQGLRCESSVSKAGAIPDVDGEMARLFGAEPGTLYLLRPDLHIAGRWKTIIAGEILRTADICLGRPTP